MFKEHKLAVAGFLAVCLGHLSEHLIQAVQFFVLGMSRAEAMGLLGFRFHGLMMNETLHYGFAVVMLVGLWYFRNQFTGAARTYWRVAIAFQFWHHFEHLILLYQKQTGDFWFGGAVQTSVGQIWFPRLELHLFYNIAVTIPMVMAMYYSHRSSRGASPRRAS